MNEALISELVGPHFGVLEQCERVPPEPDDVPLEVFAGRLANTEAFAELQAHQVASGAALDLPQAKAACVGEAIERYSSALPSPGSIVRCRADELSGAVVCPDQFALFASWQYGQPGKRFPFGPWNQSHPIGWTKAMRMTPEGFDSFAWLPATFVWLPYAPAKDEIQIAPCLSTGLACGTDFESAVFSGLCEVIERDALALAWLGKHAPPRIEFEPNGANNALDTIVERIAQRGLQWSLFDLTTDLGVPIAAALLEGHSALGWIVAAGSACHPDPERAMHKALVEAAHCRMYIKSLLRRQPSWKANARFHNVTSFADHARFYTVHRQWRQPLDRWQRRGTTRKWKSADALSKSATLSDLVQQVAAARYQAYARNVTPPDIASLGLSVARVLVPGLQPLHGSHAWPHLGGERLRQLRRVFGPQARRPLRWNQFPHPWA
jgi:ribosomal protein S12 methylthiotransferase accessory factor